MKFKRKIGFWNFVILLFCEEGYSGGRFQSVLDEGELPPAVIPGRKNTELGNLAKNLGNMEERKANLI